MQLAGGEVSQVQRDYNAYSHAKAVYPLCQLAYPADLDALKAQLNTDSSLQLLDSAQLHATGLKGRVNILFNIDDFSQIYGEELILMDGAHILYKTSITSLTMTLPDLPVGIYTLRVPGGKDHNYQLTHGYLVIKAGDNTAELSFIKKFSSAIATQECYLLGLGDDIFATLRADYAQGKLIIQVITTSPHAYFPNELYARIRVRNGQGNIIYNKEIMGTGESLSNDQLPLYLGEQIEIFHQEPTRVRISPADDSVIDRKTRTNVLTLTRYGLKNINLSGDPAQSLLTRLESAAARLRDYPQAYDEAFSPFKDDIYLAINLFASPQREQLLARYQDCIPADTTFPHDDDNIGNTFIVDGRGIADRKIFSCVLDLSNKTLLVKIESGIAHHYFDNVYASVAFDDAQGKRLYTDEIIGNRTQKTRAVVLALSGYGGEVLRLFHQEPDNRLIITNATRQARLDERGKQQTYRLTQNGMERIANER